MWTRSLFGFDVDPSSVVRIVDKVLPELWRYFQNQIRWPTLPEWRNLMGNLEEFPNVVGAIDTTPYEIYRPLIEPQRLFYSGYLHYHCINTQLVMDNERHIRFVQAGFLGSTHDAVSFRLMNNNNNALLALTTKRHIHMASDKLQ